MTPIDGAQASAAGEKGAAVVAARPFGWSRPAAVLGRAARKGEASWAGAVRREGMRAENQEGRGKMNFAFFFFFHMDFQRHF